MAQTLTLLPNPRQIRLLGTHVPDRPPRVTIDRTLPPQAYQLKIGPEAIVITAGDQAGAFYAQQTLKQLRRLSPTRLPAAEIEDAPDFKVRGVMIDISRDKVPTMPTLFALVDLLAELKINQLQLYTEHTFAYANHRQVWENASPMTPQEIRKLDAYCADRFIELVPNQNSFGHMARWLQHERYRHLAECPKGFTFPWGVHHEGGFTLNPLDPRSLAMIEELYDELLPNFSSKQFNVGCDETFDLGLGKSKSECERQGKERVYLDFLLKIHEAVKKRGHTMQFWGDIILHRPELIAELPKDVIALNWGYEADHPYEKETAAFKNAAVPFYVAPGTSSWYSISGRTDNAIENLKSAAANGLASRAIGYLNTDWGDVGHLQYLPVSYLGFAAGAAYSWCAQTNRDLDLARALDVHVFFDRAKIIGKLMHDFGNIYRSTQPLANGSRLFWSLIGGQERRKLYEPVTREQFDAAEASIHEILGRLSVCDMQHPQATLIADEIRNAGAMLIHGCRRGRWRLGSEPLTTAQLIEDVTSIKKQHQRLWLARNRPGGLDDSMQRLRDVIEAYKSNRMH